MKKAVASVGVPTEIKQSEGRVAITPDGVREFHRLNIPVFVQSGAGDGAFISDNDYAEAGATIVKNAADAWNCEMVVKVKEPQASEFEYLRKDLVLFTYLHLAAYPKVAEALLASETTAFAYETVQLADNTLPLLAPMSEVAGRLAPQMGAHFLERHNGGRGVLMGGVPGVPPARVAVLGAGNVGWNAAQIAAGMGAEVVLLDKSIERLRHLDPLLKNRMTTLVSNHGSVERIMRDVDLLIGAVLVPGGRAPVVVTEEMVASMKPGSVIVDVAVDQGGCIATTHETSHASPTYLVDGVVHYAVGNMPGAVPRTSTFALANATLPFQAQLAQCGVVEAVHTVPALAHGCNTYRGALTCEPVAQALNKPFTAPLVATAV